MKPKIEFWAGGSQIEFRALNKQQTMTFKQEQTNGWETYEFAINSIKSALEYDKSGDYENPARHSKEIKYLEGLLKEKPEIISYDLKITTGEKKTYTFCMLFTKNGNLIGAKLEKDLGYEFECFYLRIYQFPNAVYTKEIIDKCFKSACEILQTYVSINDKVFFDAMADHIMGATKKFYTKLM